jgi:hypothetical protein
MSFKRLVREHAGGADLNEVAAELAFEHTVLMSAEVHVVVRREYVQIPAAGNAAIEADAAVAGDAAVHLMID